MVGSMKFNDFFYEKVEVKYSQLENAVLNIPPTKTPRIVARGDSELDSL